MKGTRDGLEARRRTLENYCSAVRFLIQPWGSLGRRQTVVVVSSVIFDAHAWMAGDLSCVQAHSTETKWRRPSLTCIFELNHLRKPGRQCSAKSVGLERRQVCVGPKRSDIASAPGWWWELRQGLEGRSTWERENALNQRAVLATADAMSSVAALSFGVSASVMRPTSPYLNAPPLAHSTTSPMPCFLVVATRRAAVRNSFRS